MGLGVEGRCLVKSEGGLFWGLPGPVKGILEATEIRCLHLETKRTGGREDSQCLVVALLELFRPGSGAVSENWKQFYLQERAEKLFS